MSVKMGTIEASEYWSSYFINGDASGLSAEEKAQADLWCERQEIKRGDFVDCSDEGRFTWFHDLYDLGLSGIRGGNVLKYTYLVRE